jgi:hypothetical protein
LNVNGEVDRVVLMKKKRRMLLQKRRRMLLQLVLVHVED